MNARFLIVWSGQVVSQFGTVLASFGAAVWVFVETGSLAWLTALTVAASLPPLLALPLVGMVDRFDRRLVMMGADVGAAAVTVGLVTIWVVAELQPWHLVVASLMAGASGSIQGSAYAAAIPSLIGPDELERANGLLQLGPSLGVVAGPGAAGLLIAVGGISPVLIIDLASFAIAIGSLAAVRFRAPPPQPAGSTFRLTEAVHWLWREARPIAYLIMLIGATNFLLAIFNLSILARGALLGGEAGAGLAPTVGGIGMMVVSLVIGARGVPQRRIQALGWSTAAFGGLTVAAGVAPSLALLVVSVGLALSTAPLAHTIIATTLHQRVPADLHGRVFGLRNAIGRGTHPLGSVAAGGLAAWSLPGAMALAGLALVTVGLVTASSRRLRPLNP